MKIQQLDKKIHNKNSFDCGDAYLNNYLKKTAGQHGKKDLSRTFVLTSDNNPSTIKGFYSLALCKVSLSELPSEIGKKYPNDVYCTLIGRLAIHKTYQGQGFGEILLIDAILKAIQSSELVPKPMIIVDAKNEGAKIFYEKLGFTSFPNQPNKLYMTQRNAKAMLEKAGVL
ncbi:GNAT family N-acetyltransferase (plasmid) [Vibrio sp. SS-MA-C1-2]|uniref:GNAT family N-acetyltransferase n=1 Tax=Vibrio sp. SS-MA-C1-2 TaxID=2908646 RepID=UPI001F239EB4|nr:GNAT family N-acetyltransferase [Vibrio sp. SS-MA-C1-2]UJF20357.1 GNAT family N-acetyltransferase [Vibrio sp. SS-MA-C1-2]